MKVKFTIITIILFRILDLYTTQLGLINFQNEEQNLLVKLFNLDIESFFILEIFFAFLFAMCYFFYTINRKAFIISKNTFLDYSRYYFFGKTNLTLFELIFKQDKKKTLILVGSVLPIYIISTSIIFSINNYWVYLFNLGNELAIYYYQLLNKYYFFDFIIFIFPPLFLVYLLYRKLKTSYLIYK